MTTTDMPTQSQTSLFESVRISVEPNSVLHTSPEMLAEAENKFFFDWGNVVKLFADTILYVCGKSELFCKIWFALTHNDAFAK